MFKKPEILSVNKRIVESGEATWACGAGDC